MNGVMWKWLAQRRSSILPVGSLRARLAWGAFWALVGSAAFRGLELVANVLTGRMLGKVAFGELGIIVSTVGFVSVFAAMGLGMTTTKYVAELRKTEPDRSGKIIGMSTLATIISGGLTFLILFFLSNLLAERTLNAPQLANELRLISSLLFFEALNGVQLGTLAGLEEFKIIAQLRLLRGIINLPLMIAGVWIWGLPGAVGAMVLVSAGACLINRYVLNRECRRAGITITYRGLKTEWGVLWQFSIPAFLAGSMVGPVIWISNTILVNQPNGYAEMGIYNAANQWGTAIMFLPHVLSQAVMPMLASLYGVNDKQSTKKLLKISIFASALASLPIVSALVVGSKQIMGLYGPEFTGRGEVLVLVALTTALLAIETPVGKIIAASGRMWVGTVMNLGWGLTLLTCAWLFVQRGWGANGLALSYLIAYAVHGVWTFGFAISVLRGKSVSIQSDVEKWEADV